jgi:DNA-binding response OmpR family regulator
MPNILLVDDDPRARTIVANALSRPQRTIDVAAHGEDAMARIAERMPDLIITDVVMPRMNGWALVRRLRATPETAFIPVIFMTGLDTPQDRIRGFRIGADDYVTKPVNLDELELRVENVLHHAHGARDAFRKAGLSGDLSQFGISTPLSILELERKTGVLTLERPPERAEIVIELGRITRAAIEGKPVRSIVDCIGELITWTTGRFSFAEQPVEASEGLHATTASILLEAARKMDEHHGEG